MTGCRKLFRDRGCRLRALALLALIAWRRRPGSLWVAVAAALLGPLGGLPGMLAGARHGVRSAIGRGLRGPAQRRVVRAVAGAPGRAADAPGRDCSGACARSRWPSWCSAALVALALLLAGHCTPSGSWPAIMLLAMAISGWYSSSRSIAIPSRSAAGRSSSWCLGLGGDLRLRSVPVCRSGAVPSGGGAGLAGPRAGERARGAADRDRPGAASVALREAPTVSRHLLFHTAALTGAGLYLLAVGAAGYYLRHGRRRSGAPCCR